ncbi:hypothetical protein ACF08N_11250 [Streptomyces sp. NPDC015127]|uniref:hypothetical protein n=1 Tax=Streptomyces sp. NPDC015127 TaxID=3364939 RepID=UPI0036F9EC43
MASQAAMPRRRRRHRTSERPHHGRLGLLLPALLAVTVGIWAASIQRFENGGIATGGQWVLGVVCAVAVGAVAFGLGRIQHALPRELRALAYGALTAVIIGFLTSLAGGSVLRAAGIGVAVGLGLGLVTFYYYYTHE